VLGLLWTPWCTLAGRLGGVPSSGERSDGGFHSGDVERRIRISQRLRKSLGGRVLLGGESCSGVSFQGMARSSSSSWLTAGVTVGFLVCGGSLASVMAQRLQQFFRITGYQKSVVLSIRRGFLYSLWPNLPRKDTVRALCC